MTKRAVSRRQIVSALAVGGAAAATGLNNGSAAAQTFDAGLAADQAAETLATSKSLTARQKRALDIRVSAALDGVRGTSKPTPLPTAPSEALRPVQFAKALRRTATAIDKDPSLPGKTEFASYRQTLDTAYVRALGADDTGVRNSFADIERLASDIGSQTATPDEKFKWTNPLGGLGYDIEGIDPPHTMLGTPASFDPVHEFTTAETAAQMAESYWLALLREVNFADLDPDTEPAANTPVYKAWQDLNTFSWYGKTIGPIPWNRLFRADLRSTRNATNFGFNGVEVGPYLSQFLFVGTAEKGFHNEDEGIVSFGTLRLSQKQRTALAGKDYLFTLVPLAADQEFLAVQNGSRTAIGRDQFERDQRFLSTLRDGATYVHFDEIYQEYLVAASILLSRIPRMGNNIAALRALSPAKMAGAGALATQAAETSAIPDDMLNIGNPYRGAAAQVGFATFGVTHILTLLAEVSTRAHKAAWYHKWCLRWLRPEEFAARVQATIDHAGLYKIHPDLLASSKAGAPTQILTEIAARNGAQPDGRKSYLLPMAYPEGCPTHPARPSGHSVVAGASTTILKALFNGDFDLAGGQAPVDILVPNRTGTKLGRYTGKASNLTITGELNKLASNVSMFRMAGGVHWRGDTISGMLLGEQIALHLLIEQTTAIRDRSGNVTTSFYGEVNGKRPFFRIGLFNGKVVDVKDGRIHHVTKGALKSSEQWPVDPTGLSLPDFISQNY